MSRIGKKPVIIPDGVKAAFKDGILSVTGPKGELTLVVHPKVMLNMTDKEITVDVPKKEDKKQKALWGLFRSLVNNLMEGVTKGYEKKLEVNGVGFKVASTGTKLVLNLGFSHPIEIEVPQGLEAKVEKNVISISGADKQLVGQFAANVRELKKPEPYKGKGIKYSDEIVRRKAGKVVKAVGGAK
ncbi:MAG: 50S ribosomal protein L6 [Candidatus Doudnabacteria bacterium CG10_big_fil_rev_8_21_14_0_10_42_18]|uniref:Large ribosomal subunit protein uL6 n=1 Tax=Candidatus Doudnabacteria bacterium CG10_big_fil_rev_8_21_14_0_10_42_18 TaxID=1974552 RepID=A0A2H0VBL9_9BACT|nr:MAG: 50S ribosomal protein L6 [Candidatus Doudnabacteria bacterium CG10_big_fil_rev_8_21_14_0_10_42_18]